MENIEQPFAELPEALVEEMLSKSEAVGDALHVSFQKLQESKGKFRLQLSDKNLLKSENEVAYSSIPTTCGIDGSYAVEKLLAVDLIACAGVSVEGITPPSEKSYWEKPLHKVFIKPQQHNPDTGTVIRGLMMEMELGLAAKAPHDIVFLDGSFATPLIYMNQAVNKILDNNKLVVGEEVIKGFSDFVVHYKTILESTRSDKMWVAVPKYTTRREIGKKFNWPPEYDDRAVLTSVLKPGEFTWPTQMEPPSQPWHLKSPNGETDSSFNNLLQKVHVIYYKPYNWTPALRLEVTAHVASNASQIGVLLQGVRRQCITPGILEPYPLYLADRMVKHLSKAIPAFRQTAMRRMMEHQKGDVSEIFFGMHGYRTDKGR